MSCPDVMTGFMVRRRAPMPRNQLEESKTVVHRLAETDDIPPWREQITLRSVVFGLVLGFVFTIITMKLNLTAGIIPSLGMAATLLGFFAMTTWSSVLQRFGFITKPFTPQVSDTFPARLLCSGEAN
jgi:hydrogenase-4 membrane subunit HyfE